jgi:hypothetical protein
MPWSIEVVVLYSLVARFYTHTRGNIHAGHHNILHQRVLFLEKSLLIHAIDMYASLTLQLQSHGRSTLNPFEPLIPSYAAERVIE